VLLTMVLLAFSADYLMKHAIALPSDLATL
jgi:hypothetical protein